MLERMEATRIPTREARRRFYDELSRKAGGMLTAYMYRTPAQRRRRERLLTLVARLVEEHHLETCLEIGCCEGDMTRRLHGLFGYVHAVDVSPACLAAAPRLENVYYAQADVETWEPSGQYDLCLCSEVLEHVECPGVVVSRLMSHARFLLVSTPLGEPLSGRAFDSSVLGMEPEQGASSGHIWSWDMDGLLEVLESGSRRVKLCERCGASAIVLLERAQ